jgi:hypothetical protein
MSDHVFVLGGIVFVYFYDFSTGFWNCFDMVVFFFSFDYCVTIDLRHSLDTNCINFVLKTLTRQIKKTQIVKPVYKRHPGERENVPLISSCPLYALFIRRNF